MDDLYFRTKYDYYSKKEIIENIRDLLIKNKTMTFDAICKNLKQEYNVKYINKKSLLELIKANFLYEQKRVSILPHSIFDSGIDHIKEIFRDILIYRFDDDINLILSSFKTTELKKAWNNQEVFEMIYPLFKKRYTSLKAYRNYVPYIDYNYIKNREFSLRYFVSDEFNNFLAKKECYIMNDLLNKIKEIEFYEYYEEIAYVIRMFHLDFNQYIDEYNNLFNEREIMVLKNRFLKRSVKELAEELEVSTSRVSQIEEKAKEKFSIIYLKNEFLLIKVIRSLVTNAEKTSIEELSKYIKDPEVFIYLGEFEYIKDLDLLNLTDKLCYDFPKIFSIFEVNLNYDDEKIIKLLDLNYSREKELYLRKDVSNLDKIIYADKNGDKEDISLSYSMFFAENINKRSLTHYLKSKEEKVEVEDEKKDLI